MAGVNSGDSDGDWHRLVICLSALFCTVSKQHILQQKYLNNRGAGTRGPGELDGPI